MDLFSQNNPSKELNLPKLKKVPQINEGSDKCIGCYLKDHTESCWNEYLAYVDEDCGGLGEDSFIFIEEGPTIIPPDENGEESARRV